MADYRCYFVNNLDQIQAAQSFDCAEDAEAMLKAVELAESQPLDVEVWSGARLVGRVAQAATPQRIAGKSATRRSSTTSAAFP